MKRGTCMIKLGDRVRDNITGFTGIAIGRTEWLHGCARITIQPEKLDKDGKTIDPHTFDEQQVELVKEMPVKVSPQAAAGPGGPKRDPGRRPSAPRGR